MHAACLSDALSDLHEVVNFKLYFFVHDKFNELIICASMLYVVYELLR